MCCAPRHGSGGTVHLQDLGLGHSVQLTREGQQLSLLVEDNGIGFRPETEQASGLGLRSIAMRVERLNGTLNIDSTPGKGTTTIVEITR